MEKIKDSKWLYVVLSILMAFFLWLYVRSTNVNEDGNMRLRNIPVEFIGVDALEDRGLMISDGAAQSVTISVKGNKTVLNRLNTSEVKVSLGVSGITEPGVYTLDTKDCRVDYPSYAYSTAITDQTIIPSTLTITVSRRARREIEVRGVFNGSVNKDYLLGEFEFSPDTVEISGREELINRVDYARVVISGDNLTESVSAALPIAFIDVDGEEIKEAGITCNTDSVLTTMPIYTWKEVPLTVKLIPGGGATAENATVTIEPFSTIKVSGSKAELDALKEIVLGEIDLSQVYQKVSREFTIALSPTLNNLTGVGTAQVDVEISGLTTRTLVVENIEVVNKPRGYQVESITQSREVQIRGTEEAVSAVIPDQLRIVVDMENNITALGNQPATARVYLDSSEEVGVMGGTYSVMISVSKAR